LPARSDQLFSMTGLKAARSASSCIVKPLNPEIILMSYSLAAALLFSIILVAPDIAAAAGEANPAPPSQSNQSAPMKMKKAKKNTSSAEDLLKAYHAAYSLIYDQGDYVGGIAALHALGYDDNADVATLLGYASRKLGRYDDSKFWYERALAADPKHAVTWSYYGMWQAEQGNMLKAKDDLEKVRLICGTDCKAYKMLKDVIDGTETY
jgi:tetratricopeptide (TPR) repeat protein